MSKTVLNYGYEFEVKLLSSLMTDENFLIQVSDILKPEFFQNTSAKWIVESILSYYTKYNKSPTLVFFKTEIAKLPDSKKLLRDEAVSYLREAKKYENSEDLEYVKEQAVDFCRNQSIKSAILESVELLNNSDYDGIKVKLDNALKVGQNREVGHIYIKDFEERYQEDNRNPIETP